MPLSKFFENSLHIKLQMIPIKSSFRREIKFEYFE
jgi:hypothetical protein